MLFIKILIFICSLYNTVSLSPCGIRNSYYFNRIIGGREATPGEFPWIVSIQMRVSKNTHRHICGGTIISEQWVVTAAHCTSDLSPQNLSITHGVHNLYRNYGNTQRRVKIIDIKTKDFDITILENDIALLQLSTKLIFDENLYPICLPKPSDNFEKTALIAGWGRTQTYGDFSETLKYTHVNIIKNEYCTNNYKRIGFSRFLNECQICAGDLSNYKDSCQGDSGGPLMCKKENSDELYICGIVSWGIGCAQGNYPGLYTKVTCYKNWIQNVLGLA